ncbi:hypothetical protein JEQ12_010772 [Ovis aries]|uniref:Ig-like domain-containing protein n=1 Tax=Ovis aries TaxID=9940 RepID=A0A836CTV2_SHEEP|nr:hypothetical protein JEQ12_010772 [Ovis aries]
MRTRQNVTSLFCSLAPAAREVKVVCSEDVDLPCTAPWDPQVTYTVSWAKLTDGGAERVEVTQEDLQSPQQRNSSEAPRERLYSLRIRNTTSCNSGTYRCTLVGPEGQRNLSGTVILQVTGCSKERRGETFKNYRAEIVLLLALVIFYVTLIIFTCMHPFSGTQETKSPSPKVQTLTAWRYSHDSRLEKGCDGYAAENLMISYYWPCIWKALHSDRLATSSYLKVSCAMRTLRFLQAFSDMGLLGAVILRAQITDLDTVLQKPQE